MATAYRAREQIERKGPNEWEGGTPVNLEDARRQKTGQMVLPLEGRGEAPRGQRSGETSTAASGNERPGTDRLMEEVVQRDNAKAALKRVKQNKGSPGIDGMTVDDLPKYLAEHWDEIREHLLAGTYQPEPVKRQEIPKRGGGARELGIPTALDRFVQQAILQVLQPRFDPTFSEHSHGFRPGRRAHDAVREAQRYIQDGRRVVVDVDLEKFFDRVNHDVLMGKLSARIADKRMLGLIRRYLNAGIMANGVVVERVEGTPQGGPLSPLLANVLLDEVDKELEKRGHAFVRYADDCNVYVRSRRAGEDVMKTLRRLYGRLRLRVNEAKSAVARPQDRKFLGYSFWYAKGGEVRRRVAPKSLEAMKERVRAITTRNGGRSLQTVIAELRSYLAGWKQYFRLAETPRILSDLDKWVRHRLRLVQLKQWKRGPTIYREMKRLGANEDAACQVAANSRRWWKNSGKLLNTALPASYYDRMGVPRLEA
ncbi:MAG TPA: group II intron reverse transcriptase/maturase [Anaeromyxobacteraceae bacterium]|nr:group II intron reverse transcriptase/maturase [Anaeromyxobacteraceae bacterium]